MKTVILLAGKGRRMQVEYEGIHKALLPLNGKPLLFYLINNVKKAGIKEIVPVLGYKGEEVLSHIHRYAEGLKVYPVWNHTYYETNNLVSLLQAEKMVLGEDFIQINGDMVFDYRIITKLANVDSAAIAVDITGHAEQLDSPRVLIQNKVIRDLGRHMTIEEASGYAVGLYRFSSTLAGDFFTMSKELVKENPQLGFHEPLRTFFNQYSIFPVLTENMLWMDVDEKADISRAENFLRRMEEKDESF